MTTTTTDLLDALHGVLDALGPVAVAVSGGVDSTTLGALALARNPSETRLFHAVSPAVPAEATERLRAHAEPAGWPLSIIDAGEFADPNYLRNPVNRCFYCKQNLYQTIREHTASTVLSGANLDDLDDFRPGLRAAADHAVRHPWIEARIDKAGIRRLAAASGLHEFADLPASPCLSSRVETGIGIAGNDLRAIDAAEHLLRRELAPETVRCRCARGWRRGRTGPADPRQARRTRAAGAGRAHPRPLRADRTSGGGGLRAVPARERRDQKGSPVSSAGREVRLDVGRRARIGLDEAILCETKTPAQLSHILDEAAGGGRTMLLTRLSDPQFQALRAEHAAVLDYHALSQTGIFGAIAPPEGPARIAIVTAGSSDAGVAHEAARTLAYAGVACELVCDVGVAGLWRVLEQVDRLAEMDVVIAVAGMDAAMVSVIGWARPGTGDRRPRLHWLRRRPAGRDRAV